MRYNTTLIFIKIYTVLILFGLLQTNKFIVMLLITRNWRNYSFRIRKFFLYKQFNFQVFPGKTLIFNILYYYLLTLFGYIFMYYSNINYEKRNRLSSNFL